MLLLCSVAFAEPNLEATGNDYVLMNDDQKLELVSTLYKIFKDKEAPEDGVVALDNFYSLYQKNPTARDSEVILNAPVMRILADIISYKPDNDFHKELRKLSKFRKTT